MKVLFAQSLNWYCAAFLNGIFLVTGRLSTSCTVTRKEEWTSLILKLIAWNNCGCNTVALMLFMAAVGLGPHHLLCRLPLATSFSYGLPALTRPLFGLWLLAVSREQWGPLLISFWLRKHQLKEPFQRTGVLLAYQTSQCSQAGRMVAFMSRAGGCLSLGPCCSRQVWDSASSVDTQKDNFRNLKNVCPIYWSSFVLLQKCVYLLLWDKV